MATSKYNLSFPKALGKYWLLLWIGKIYYQEKKLKIELLFINKTTANDELRNLDFNTQYTQFVPISCLSDFRIGSLYNTEDNELVDYSISESRKQMAISRNINDYGKKEFPLLGNPYFIRNASNIIPNDFKYLEIPFFNYGKQTLALISPYCILQHFFYSDRLIKKVLSGIIMNAFHLNKAKIYDDKNSNEKLVELTYDSSLLNEKEAFIIAPFLFIKNNIGRKFIHSIYSSLLNSFISNRQKKEHAYYLDFNFEFKDYKIEFTGKELHNNHSIYYTLVYQINKIEFLSKNSFSVDRIILIPTNFKASEKKENSIENTNINKPMPTRAFIVLLNQDKASTSNPIIKKESIHDPLPFRIKVDFLKTNEQLEAYKVDLIPPKENPEGLVRELENFENDTKNLIENIEREIEYLDSKSYYEHFNNTINELEKINPEITIHRDPLDIGQDYYPIQIESLWINIIEVEYNKSYTYLIEFGSSFIGTFHHISFSKITKEKLLLLFSKFNTSSKQAKLEKKSLWTFINLLSHTYKKGYNIIIRKGIEHTRKQLFKEENIYKQTAIRIYNSRIISHKY
ncbi:hypothetical protein J2O09_10320 [Elizabethkingia anophelis]|uniref:hypothetical protein n=1 Tax=Elizabethkingia anophelis TaxID=1117645 RepID=UPI0020B8F516|nr:hypothetical protein [Elizabethkingia anophelis]MCT3664263.1 hypothetical protein [Elizabethkingia anophelis]UTG59828.1 hypothetical protein J2O09_10320 [Elizabethkingia anophelis]UXM66010.1 hypothetical protein N7E57_10335 [Elizabethkingia anophelis]